MSERSRKLEVGSRKWAALRPSAARSAGDIPSALPRSLPLVSPFGLSATGYPASSRWHVFRLPPSHFAFTLFEVLIALGVFAIAVTGLAMALDSAVQAAFEARERALSRIVLESRLSAAMSDPPVNGRRVIEARDNNGIRVEETMDIFEAKTTNGTPVTGIWKLKITADSGRGKKGQETAEILLYRP